MPVGQRRDPHGPIRDQAAPFRADPPDVDALLEQEARFLEKPVLGTIKAGYDMFADQQLLGYEPVSEQEAASGDFFLKVRGNSMINAGIRDGDLLFVRACSQVQSGEIAVVLISDEEATVKKVILKDDLMVLEAANPEVENRYFTRDEVRALPVRIIAKAVFSKTYF